MHQVERRRPWTRLLWFEDQTENSSCSCFKIFFIPTGAFLYKIVCGAYVKISGEKFRIDLILFKHYSLVSRQRETLLPFQIFNTITVSCKSVFSASLPLAFLSTWLIPITVMNSHCIWIVPGALAVFCPNKHFSARASAMFQLLGWRIPYKSTHAYSSPWTHLQRSFHSSIMLLE